MRHLSIDIETYSDSDIKKSGLFKYAQSEAFEVLLFAYSVDFGEVQIVDLAQGEIIPGEIVKALNDNTVIKHAYNAAFEWYCLNQAGYKTDIKGWQCTMFHGLYMGYPAGLGIIGEVLGLSSDKQKDKMGQALIKYFSLPCKPSRANGGRTRNLPHHDREKWDLFKNYCRQDVVTEMAVFAQLYSFPVPEREQKLWRMDVELNARGVRIDMDLVDKVLKINEETTQALMEDAVRLTNLANPNSPTQLMSWMGGHLVAVDNLTKATVAELLEGDRLSDEVRAVLEIRQELAKTSIKKYNAMANCVGEGDRARGLLQVYGANRTGRWAGRLVQVQNLPRNYIKTLDLARNLAKQGNGQGLALLYGSVSDTLSQLIRTAFIPSDGRKFIVADFSAIEARVIAWLAGEQWVMDVFATHGKIYEATASQMFGVPIERIKKGNPEYDLRQKGKVATLALGYQGGTGALVAMGAIKMGLSEDELPEIVSRWRGANKRIVDLWQKVNNAALSVMADGRPVGVGRGVVIKRIGSLETKREFLAVELPSGRALHYANPFLSNNKFDRSALHYYDMMQTTHKWSISSTYGGKLVENIVQAIARDCLAETLLRLDERYKDNPVIMHVHDEVILDANQDVSVEEICAVMGEPIPWAPGLLLKAEGFECEYYRKD